MTVSILTILAMLPSGAAGAPLTFGELGAYLSHHLKTQDEEERNRRHQLRDQLYQDGGRKFMAEVINEQFKDHATRERRKKWIPWARFANPLKRVVNEMSTVYAEPAKRSVGGSDENKKRYQDVLDAVSMDERMFQISRLLNLHRALLIGFRVRVLPSGAREPVLEHATPANVRAVLHPNDGKLVVGWLIRNDYRTARPQTDKPCWTLWTDHERVYLRDDMSVIEESYVVHNLGVCPWVPISLSPPGAGFWPGEEGEDLVAAAVSMWMLAILMLKESKSATKVNVVAGDGTTAARGQGTDSEGALELAEGQTLTTVDMSMDLSMFRDSTDHVLGHVAMSYGMAAPLVNNQGVQSADAREALRIPLREIRKHQLIPFRRVELGVVLVMAAVLAVDLPEMAFDPAGWMWEPGEFQTPLTRKEETDLFLVERGAGLDNTVDMIVRRKQCDEDQAWSALERNIDNEGVRNVLMRPMVAQSGSLGASTPAAPQPGATAPPQPQPVPPAKAAPYAPRA